MGSSALPLARGKPSQGTEVRRLSGFTSYLCPGKQVTVSHPPGEWEAGLRALSSPVAVALSPPGLKADG